MWKTIVFAVLVALGTGAVGSSATPVDIAGNDAVTAGPLEIAAGDDAMTSVQPGEPAIDLTATGAGGIAPGTTMVLGDVDDPASDHAFTITNPSDEAVAVRIEYDYAHEPPSTAGVSFSFVDAAGEPLPRTHDGSAWVEIAPGTTAYVIVTIDSSGTTPADDLSGSLTFGVSESLPR